MSIFGSLKTLPLAEALSLLRKREGILTITEVNDLPSCHLIISQGHLLALYIDNLQIKKPEEIHKYITHLLNLDIGKLSFRPRIIQKKYTHAITFEKLVGQEKIKDNAANLPHHQTYFTLTAQAKHPRKIPNQNLRHFYSSSARLLRQKSNAESIAETLSIKTEFAQYYLHKLRLLGYIAPIRAYAESSQQKTNTRISANSSKTVVHRLLTALKMS